MDLRLDTPELRAALQTVCDLAHAAGGRALAVGGCVRDSLLGRPVKDLDIEVFGISPETLNRALTKRFRIDRVGESFGIIKLRGLPVDIAQPRRESKTGPGHKAFDVVTDPRMSFEEAAARRDFTINAMGYDPRLDRIYDPFGGVADLRRRILRHTSDQFVEDPLRVLRGMQFVARFDLTPTPQTIRLCAAIDSEGLARERVFEEWKKLLLKGVTISRGLRFLRHSGWLRHYPELAALVACPQDPQWHPEGDVWTHTLLCMDAFAGDRLGNDAEDLIVGLAVLCHDTGKPLTTTRDGDRIRSMGHSEAGETPTRRFLARLTNQTDLVHAVVLLVRDHLRPIELFKGQASDAAVRRLAQRVHRIDRLVRVARADLRGGPRGNATTDPAGDWLLERAARLSVQDAAPVPLVMGRHLLDLGLPPGPAFKPILEACYEAQIEGRITSLEDGIALAKQRLATASGKGQRDGALPV